MHNVEFTQEVTFGDKRITSITVSPLPFLQLCDIWATLPQTGEKVRGLLQRARILKQTTFKAGDDVVVASAADIAQLHTAVAKQIIAALDIGVGATGALVGKGDGMQTPVIYKLGTPIHMKQGQATVSITELEFMAHTYGQLEDVLAAGTDAEKAKFLLRDIAVPLGGTTLQRLPAWALDRITSADGVAVMNLVCPLF